MSIPVHDHFGHCPICNGECRLFGRVGEGGFYERLVAACVNGAEQRQAVRHRIAAVINGAMARARNEEEVFALDVADDVLQIAAELYADN